MPDALSPREILDALVEFPTISRDSNLDLVDWVEAYLSGFGVTSRRVFDATGRKAALYANVGPEVEGGVILSGHTDVVPVDGQNWSSDPFRVVERDGRLYGRGACDMKGFDALALAAVPWALEAGVKRPLQIALSYDEEVGCLGAPPMIEDMARHLPRAGAAVIGEPTMMQCVTGQNGGFGFDVEIIGHEVHSSRLHEGVNAVMEGAKLIDWVNNLNVRLQSEPAGPMADHFDPPFTTVHVGIIEGGTAHNITAGRCRFPIGFRIVPGTDMESLEAELREKVAEIEAGMKQIADNARVDMTNRFHVPPLFPTDSNDAETLVRRLTGDNGTHGVTFGAEAGQFQERGYPTVICGPGDIAQAHQADEYISVSQFESGADFMRRLVAELAQ